MMPSPEEAEQMLFIALNTLSPERVEQLVPAAVHGWRSYDYLYLPDAVLKEKIVELNQRNKRWSTTAKGRLMEEIALLTLKSLKGWSSIKSYQSFAAQLDLVVTGDDPDWKALISLLRLPWEQRTMVVEAKYLRGKVEDHQFSRLCSVLHTSFGAQASLGIFFTIHGATGFPKDDETLRSLHDAQATQILFHARTNKYVVVFDEIDIQRLGEPGAFPRLLEQKIRAVEAWTGRTDRLPKSNAVEWHLPPHLEQHLTQVHGNQD